MSSTSWSESAFGIDHGYINKGYTKITREKVADKKITTHSYRPFLVGPRHVDTYAHEGKKMVGVIQGSHDKKTNTTTTKNIYVMPDQRRKGVGTNMIAAQHRHRPWVKQQLDGYRSDQGQAFGEKHGLNHLKREVDSNTPNITHNMDVSVKQGDFPGYFKHNVHPRLQRQMRRHGTDTTPKPSPVAKGMRLSDGTRIRYRSKTYMSHPLLGLPRVKGQKTTTARVKGKTVGSISAARDDGEIMQVHTDEALRRKGVATGMLRELQRVSPFQVKHSSILTEDGAKWSARTKTSR